MAAISSPPFPGAPPPIPTSALDTLFANLAPYFQASLSNIHYTATAPTPDEIAHLEQVVALLSSVNAESVLVDENAKFLFYVHSDHLLQIDYFWVIKHVVLPYAIAYDKKEVVTTILSLSAHFLGKGELLNQVLLLANNYIYENPKFGALPEEQAPEMWEHIQAIFPQEPDSIALDAPPPSPVSQPAPAAPTQVEFETTAAYAAYIAATAAVAALPPESLPTPGRAPPEVSLEERRAARRFRPY